MSKSLPSDDQDARCKSLFTIIQEKLIKRGFVNILSKSTYPYKHFRPVSCTKEHEIMLSSGVSNSHVFASIKVDNAPSMNMELRDPDGFIDMMVEFRFKHAKCPMCQRLAPTN